MREHQHKPGVALVTGASSGIGAATVQQLVGRGYLVYAAARRLERMEQLSSTGVRLLQLDLTEEQSVTAAVARIRSETGRLDVLINNAGYGSFGALEDIPIQEARRQFEVNLFGAARLIQLALPIMREQHAATIVNVTSVGGKIHEPFGSWYHATKFALEGLSDCLRLELAPFGIRVIVIEPGGIRTEWGRIAYENLISVSGGSAYARWARLHAGMLARADSSRLLSDPVIVAATIANAVSSVRPKTRYATGGGAKFILLLRKILSDRGFDFLMWKGSQSPQNASYGNKE